MTTDADAALLDADSTDVPDLPSDFDRVDEIHVPGDPVDETQGASDADAPSPSASVETGGGEAESESDASPDAESGPDEASDPPSRLQALREKLDASIAPADSDAQAPADPRDRELADARARINQMYESQIAELKAQRSAAATPKDDTPAPDPVAARAARAKAAATVLAERLGLDEDQAADIVGTMTELTAMEREEFERNLAPLRQAQEQAVLERQRSAYIQAVSDETKAGIAALHRSGGVYAELVDEFRSKSRIEDSFLGRALVEGWDPKSGALPPKMQDRQVVEALGIALGTRINEMLADSSFGSTNGNGRPSGGPSGIVPKRRQSQSPSQSRSTDESEQIFEEMSAHMGDAADILLSSSS